MSASYSWVGAVVVAVSCSACVARVQAEPVQPEPAAVEVTSETVPVNIETYPSTAYEGRTVYLWGDRWYYRNGSRWAYYRNEPDALRRHRVLVQSAPPAQRERGREEERHEEQEHGDHQHDWRK